MSKIPASIQNQGHVLGSCFTPGEDFSLSNTQDKNQLGSFPQSAPGHLGSPWVQGSERDGTARWQPRSRAGSSHGRSPRTFPVSPPWRSRRELGPSFHSDGSAPALTRRGRPQALSQKQRVPVKRRQSGTTLLGSESPRLLEGRGSFTGHSSSRTHGEPASFPPAVPGNQGATPVRQTFCRVREGDARVQASPDPGSRANATCNPEPRLSQPEFLTVSSP